jgi:RNA polymerase sigma-70 factor, ECF subfamily
VHRRAHANFCAMTSEDACSAERLTQLVKDGHPDALDQITRCYADRLLAAGRKHCRSSDEASDAVQDALLTATAHLAQFRAEGSLEGWLVRIVARACRRIGRGRKNDGTLHQAELELEAGAPTPEQDAAAGELRRILDATLLALNHQDRALLLLAELEDWTAAEIGAELGLSPGAVRTRLTRLRTRVREALSPVLEENAPTP